MPRLLIKSVKAAITMEQVLNHYGLLSRFKRNGDNLSGPCPFHQGSNATQFRVNVKKNVWTCVGDCKHGGDVLDFIAISENISLQAAVVKAIEWFKLNPQLLASEIQVISVS